MKKSFLESRPMYFCLKKLSNICLLFINKVWEYVLPTALCCSPCLHFPRPVLGLSLSRLRECVSCKTMVVGWDPLRSSPRPCSSRIT